MNLGGASNINLSEASRLLNQNNIGANVGVQNQQVPPPMMFMQQAVAMQQFQFQQALLMQQVMATQQAVARAATVKSAQEMAAARAAEISKLLKGIEPHMEEGKKSPQRFVSQTPSRSRSRSFSRSKSQSPIRYRRDRSISRSPIRYRHESHQSPISREYFGYRGQSRRSYCRGRNEYSWNPSFRHDWERERDHYSLCVRHSRSHSRSRVCRRSHTPSRSPRSQRNRGGTPLRYRYKEKRLDKKSRHSRSIEAKPTPSRSHSLGCSRSRSRSKSLHHDNLRHSPVQKSRDKRIGIDCDQEKKVNVVLGGGQCTLMKKFDTNGIKEMIYNCNVSTNENEEIVEHWSFKPKTNKEHSNSPARSLSVSLSPQKTKEKAKVESDSKPSEKKKAIIRSVLSQRMNKIESKIEPLQNNVEQLEHFEVKEFNSNIALEQQIDIKDNFQSKEGEFFAIEQSVMKDFEKMESSYEETDGDKEVDDWCNDIKAHELEKVKRKEYKKVRDEREEVKIHLNVPIARFEDIGDHDMELCTPLNMETKKLRVDPYTDSRDQVHTIATTTSSRGIPKNDIVFAKSNFSDEIFNNGSYKEEDILEMLSNGPKEDSVEVDEEIEDLKNEKNKKCDDFIDREGDYDLIFEGPVLPPDLDVETKNYSIQNCCDICQEIGAEEQPLVVVEEVVLFKKKDKSRGKKIEELKDGNNEKWKLKDKSHSRKRSRDKKYNNKSDYGKRKEKHRKYKHKHRLIKEIEKKKDDNDEGKDVDPSKCKEDHHCHCTKKCGRSRNHKEGKREKKRHKHKHRRKLTSKCQDLELLIEEVEDQDMD